MSIRMILKLLLMNSFEVSYMLNAFGWLGFVILVWNSNVSLDHPTTS